MNLTNTENEYNQTTQQGHNEHNRSSAQRENDERDRISLEHYRHESEKQGRAVELLEEAWDDQVKYDLIASRDTLVSNNVNNVPNTFSVVPVKPKKKKVNIIIHFPVTTTATNKATTTATTIKAKCNAGEPNVDPQVNERRTVKVNERRTVKVSAQGHGQTQASVSARGQSQTPSSLGQGRDKISTHFPRRVVPRHRHGVRFPREFVRPLFPDTSFNERRHLRVEMQTCIPLREQERNVQAEIGGQLHSTAPLVPQPRQQSPSRRFLVRRFTTAEWRENIRQWDVYEANLPPHRHN
jgi:hypothetical protein